MSTVANLNAELNFKNAGFIEGLSNSEGLLKGLSKVSVNIAAQILTLTDEQYQALVEQGLRPLPPPKKQPWEP